MLFSQYLTLKNEPRASPSINNEKIATVAGIVAPVILTNKRCHTISYSNAVKPDKKKAAYRRDEAKVPPEIKAMSLNYARELIESGAKKSAKITLA